MSSEVGSKHGRVRSQHRYGLGRGHVQEGTFKVVGSCRSHGLLARHDLAVSHPVRHGALGHSFRPQPPHHVLRFRFGIWWQALRLFVSHSYPVYRPGPREPEPSGPPRGPYGAGHWQLGPAPGGAAAAVAWQRTQWQAGSRALKCHQPLRICSLCSKSFINHKPLINLRMEYASALHSR